MVRRKIQLAETLTIDSARRILGRLRAMDGVREVAGGEKLNIRVTYDSQRTDFGALLAALKGEGVEPSPSRWFRIKSACFQYLDETGRACCHRPSDTGNSKRQN